MDTSQNKITTYFTTKKHKGNCRPCFAIKGGVLNNKKAYLLQECDKKSDRELREIILPNGMVQLIPTYNGANERNTLYIAGQSGSGKSTFAANYAKEYKKKFPKDNLVLISPKEEDEVLDRLNPIRITPNEHNFIDEEEKLTMDELQDSLVIFDDYEGIIDRNIKKSVMDLRDQILTLGRSKRISIVVISHLLTDNKNTKIPITESQYVIFFPNGGLNYQILRFLKSYCGMGNKEAKEILKIPSRWICLHKNFPMYLISKDSAKLL
jgi:tRNA uridine 5-carbamoylmethylation protein Kti12